LKNRQSARTTKSGRQYTSRRVWIVSAVLAVLLLVGLFIDINAGYSTISLSEMAEILTGGGSGSLRYTLLELRLPRVLTSMLVGIGLAASGCILQGVSRNDMADPGILGLNAGSGLMIALFIVLISGTFEGYSFLLPLLAFSGSAIVAFIEYKLALVGGRLRPKRLLLMGVAISLAISSLTTMLMLKMPDSDYAFVQNWLAGNIWGASWLNVMILFAGLLMMILFSLYHSRVLNIFGLGQENAISLGVNVEKESLLLISASVVMSSLCCAVGGGLSFVGLICPHLARKLTGPNYRSLIIVTVLCGAVLLVFSDIISRTLLLPSEIPIGIVSAVIGAPYFLYLLMKE